MDAAVSASYIRPEAEPLDKKSGSLVRLMLVKVGYTGRFSLFNLVQGLASCSSWDFLIVPIFFFPVRLLGGEALIPLLWGGKGQRGVQENHVCSGVV